MAQLASARLSEREVSRSIFSDFNVCFDFALIRVAIPLNTDVTNTVNGERETGNRERESGNKCTAATLLRIQNGGQNKRKGSNRNNLGLGLR